MSHPQRCLAIGLNVVDVLARLPETYHTGEKHEIQELAITGGGPAGNAGCVTAALGIPTGFLGRFGNDTISRVGLAELERCGVSADYVIHDRCSRPALSVVEIDPHTGERTVFYNTSGYGALTSDDVPEDAVLSAGLVLSDGYEPIATERALQLAFQANVPSVVDVENGEATLLLRLIELASDPVVPIGTGRRLTQQDAPEAVLAELAQLAGGRVVVTDGVNGCWGWTAEGVLHQPAFATEVLDTTGCGDAYHGAYGAARMLGAPLSLCMEFASLYASCVATVLGGRRALPNWQRLYEKSAGDASEALLAFVKRHLPMTQAAEHTNEERVAGP